jgi:hypothetical protein
MCQFSIQTYKVLTCGGVCYVFYRVCLVNRVPGENHRPAASHCQTLSHNVVSGPPRLSGIRTHNCSGDRY